MALPIHVDAFNEIITKISKLELEQNKINEITTQISLLNSSLMSYVSVCDLSSEHRTESSKFVKRKMDYKCLKCNQSDPSMFNRKKSECTPCMSKSLYKKQKITIEKGKERNIITRLSRKECTVCKYKVTRENALSFDWDHRDAFEKTYQISKMNCKSDDLFYAEIEKCDLVCRNCHALRTKHQFDNNLIPKRKCKTIENKLVLE
jgi:hypothetical protein